MSAHAIWIKFTIKEGCMDEFMEASMYDAKHSMEDEPACQHFRVMTTEDEPNTVYFLEVYDDKEGHIALIRITKFSPMSPSASWKTASELS